MATSGTYGSNFTTAAGSPGSAGTDETRVDRPNEGLPGVATTGNNPANTPTRGNFDTFKATGLKASRQNCQIDTTGIASTPSHAVQQANTTAWAFVAPVD